MNSLADYYTEEAFADLLVASLNIEGPTSALDLGAGGGALLTAVIERWPQARLHAAELDPRGCFSLNNRFPGLRLFQGSGLAEELTSHLGIEESTVDVAVCNPPYLSHPHTDRTANLLKEAGLEGCRALKKLTSDLLFLAQNLRLLREGGQLGIILPDTLISGKEYAVFREALMNNHRVFGIVQLPYLAFRGAEAQTHAVLIQRGGLTDRQVPLWRADSNGEVDASIAVPSDRLVQRMDHGYHAWRAAESPCLGPSLADLGVCIKRGSLTHGDCRARGLTGFHTCDFKPNGKLDLTRAPPPSGVIAAVPGDILVARVGSRCIGRVGLVRSGTAAITDCVYRLRTPEKWRHAIWRALRSDYGQAWFQANAYGVAARSISKTDLLAFPVRKE